MKAFGPIKEGKIQCSRHLEEGSGFARSLRLADEPELDKNAQSSEPNSPSVHSSKPAGMN